MEHALAHASQEAEQARLKKKQEIKAALLGLFGLLGRWEFWNGNAKNQPLKDLKFISIGFDFFKVSFTAPRLISSNSRWF